MTRFSRFTVFALIFSCFGITSFLPQAKAQSSSFFNQRDDTYTLLGLKRAKAAYEEEESNYDRQKELFDKKLISEADLEKARRTFENAQVDYYQSLLSVLFEKQYVTVTEAIKYQGEGTRKHVRLQIANAAAGGGEYEKLINIDDELFKSLQPDVVNDAYVSLLNDTDAIIGLPYEQKIEKLEFGKPKWLEFTMLQDQDAVSVNIIYGNGSERRLKVFLQKDASVNQAAIQADQFSQEVDLGNSTDFGMSLELFSGESNTFKLDVVNLPPEVTRYFLDPASNNRLSQFQFTEGVNTRQAALRIFLPERPTENVHIDEAVPFFAVAIPRERIEEIGDLRTKKMTENEVKALNVGYVRLELVPRGVGEIVVKAPQLFYTIKANETVEVPVEVVNEGTRELNNVRVDVEPPLNWEDVVSPTVVENLDINEESKIMVTMTPPADVTPGRYEVRLKTKSLSEDQTIEGEDKTVTIQIEQEANVLGTFVIILFIVGLVVGIVIFGIRLSRR